MTSLFEQVGYDEAQIAIDKAAYGEEEDGAALVTLPWNTGWTESSYG